jgi:NADH:ubiquinone reductase (H+-translocating)
MSTNTNHRVVVLGGGYTGIMAAIRVARRTRRQAVQVTLVNPSPRFTERLRMHQIAAGQELAEYAIPDLLAGTGVRFVQGRAVGIDRDARRVRLANGPDLGYDTLVHAIGSTSDPGVPGAEGAHTLDSPDEAARLARRLAELDPAGGTVAVAGNGLTGVEAATEIAERHPNLHVVLLGRQRPGVMMGAGALEYLDRALVRLGIEVRSGVEITKVLPDAVELDGGELVAADATLWTTGFRAPALAAAAGLAVDERGRVLVDDALRSTTDPTIYAVGDAAAVRQHWGTLHGTCQSGIPTAVHVGDSIARTLRGKEPTGFRFGYVHQPVSLGRHDAVIQFTHGDDTPRRWFLAGRAAVAYKEIVSSSPPSVYRLSKRLTIPAATLSVPGGRDDR